MTLQCIFDGQSVGSINDPETIEILRLIRSENVGPRVFFSLLKIYETPSKALAMVQELSLRGGASRPIKLYSKDEAANELNRLKKIDAGLITYKSPMYPRLLLQIHDFPPVITYKGNLSLFDKTDCIGIVGARNCSINGKIFAKQIALELIQAGYTIVSGLARGIDTAAHEADPANTIAVLAGGIDHIYPAENAALCRQIAKNGLLIAESPIGAKPMAQHFPQRNRLISGISLGIVVIEASLKSGTLTTARFAIEQNREVFAVPGFPLDPRNQGTNKLIKEGAILIESASDVIQNLEYLLTSNKKENKDLQDNDINSYYSSMSSSVDSYMEIENMINDQMRNKVLNLLSFNPVDLDHVIEVANLPLQIVYVIMLELELAGKVIRDRGNKIALSAQNMC